MKKISAMWPIWCLASIFLVATPASAFFITGVSAPNLTRPLDGILYPFSILVNGTYTRADLILGGPINVTAEYWDEDVFLDDAIDLLGLLTVPAPGGAANGAPWGPVPVAFNVGCTTGGEVFGPSGNTGEGNMNDGYFRFTTGAGLTFTNHGSWGYNTVQCVANSTGTNPAPPHPALISVPEPSSIALFAGGAAMLIVSRRRKSSCNARVAM
ncbi:PEP-CTERM sorting domain-containing protein [Thiobacillus sp.]